MAICLTAIGLDLQTFTFWEAMVFSTKPQKVKLFAGGSTATKFGTGSLDFNFLASNLGYNLLPTGLTLS